MPRYGGQTDAEAAAHAYDVINCIMASSGVSAL